MKKLLLITAVIFQSYFTLGATTWLGLIDSDWSKVGNWDGPVPGVGDDVVIPDCSGGNCPVIDGFAASTKKLTVDENATLIVQGVGGALTSDELAIIDGDFTVGPSATFSGNDKVEINGVFTVDPSATFSAADDVDVGKTNDNATFTNNGTADLAKGLNAEGSTGGLGDGPFIFNTGDMDVLGELKLGNDDGAGTLTNSGNMSFDTSHIHGAIINTGTMGFTTEMFLHGAVLSGGGSIDTPSVKLDKKNGRAADIGAQSVYNGSPSCNGNGASDSGVEYNGDTFQELMDADGETSDKYTFSDPGNFNSCNESAASALPVELISFSGQFINENTSLSWSTATETNNDYFVIEKSSNGIDFSIIGKVDGNGTTNETSNYSYTDYKVSGFQSFYRLKQVDYDGAFEYFNTIMVMSIGTSDIKIYPNPTTTSNVLKVEVNNTFEQELVSVELTDLSGRTLNRKVGYDNLFEFSTVYLTRGTYLIKTSVNSIVRTNRVLVN